jgi:hypothetical protein
MSRFNAFCIFGSLFHKLSHASFTKIIITQFSLSFSFFFCQIDRQYFSFFHFFAYLSTIQLFVIHLSLSLSLSFEALSETKEKYQFTSNVFSLAIEK